MNWNNTESLSWVSERMFFTSFLSYDTSAKHIKYDFPSSVGNIYELKQCPSHLPYIQAQNECLSLYMFHSSRDTSDKIINDISLVCWKWIWNKTRSQSSFQVAQNAIGKYTTFLLFAIDKYEMKWHEIRLIYKASKHKDDKNI